MSTLPIFIGAYQINALTCICFAQQIQGKKTIRFVFFLVFFFHFSIWHCMLFSYIFFFIRNVLQFWWQIIDQKSERVIKSAHTTHNYAQDRNEIALAFRLYYFAFCQLSLWLHKYKFLMTLIKTTQHSTWRAWGWT